jgi:ABC-type antimicrobial peptide transport system permease subunit
MVAVTCLGTWDADAVAAGVVRRLEGSAAARFDYQNLGALSDDLKGVTGTESLFAVGVAAIAILVGGMGVMNTLMASVETRTREIGVYTALGAKRRDIIRVWLLEAQVICLIGGGLGAAVSLIAQWIIERVTGLVFIGGGFVGVCLLSAALCGAVFGIAPAAKASKLDPISAIRQE